MAFELKSLSTAQMLAQRVMPRLNGELIKDKEYMKGVQALVDAGVGGFILFGGDFWEVREGLAKLQSKAKIPLMIGSDMERGAGQQLKGATVFPCQMAVAASVDLGSGDGLGILSDMLEGVAEEARAAGVHVVFSPVLDVNSNPANPIICTRAFSDEPHAVSGLGERYVAGLQGGHLPVMACIKHFPGHGDAQIDSHTHLPTIDKDRESLEEEDIYPFRRGIMAGAEAVMTAHLKVPALDPAGFPASLSYKITHGWLRNRSNFEGLVFTDALDMGALKGHYPPPEAAKLAVKAEADILLHPADPAGYVKMLEEIAKKRELTKDEIFAAAGRITRAKLKYCQSSKLSDKQVVPLLRKNQDIADAVAQRALTLVKAAGAFPSLKELPGKVAHFVLEDDGDKRAGMTLRTTLARKHKNVENMFITRTDAAKLKAKAMASAKDAAVVIVSVFSKVSAGKGHSGISEDLAELGRQLIARNRRSVAVSFGSPYILKNFMDAQYVVAAYDPGEAMQNAACRAFAGEIFFMGELPVRLG